MSITGTNLPKVLLWEVRAVAILGPTGKTVTFILLEGLFLPPGSAVSVCEMKFPVASEGAWPLPGVWTITSSLEATVEEFTWFWPKVMFSIWGSVLLSDHWFHTAAETIRKWISENLLASEKKRKPKTTPWAGISVKKWIYSSRVISPFFHPHHSNYSCNPMLEIMKLQYYI